MSDPVDDRLRRLAEVTDPLPLPSGFEARVLSRLQKRALESAEGRSSIESSRDVSWSTLRSALPIALVAAVAAVSIAIWQDLQLTDALVLSPDSVSDPESKDP